MPRKKRQESESGVYHWIIRGMNKKDLFHEADDYERILSLLLEYKNTYLEAIYHYCLMTNHVHVLLKAHRLLYLSQFSHYVQRRYAYYYCGRYAWTGSVLQRGFRSFPVEKDEYLLECARYIERNPVKARLVKKAEHYRYTSAPYYIYSRQDVLVTPSPAFLRLHVSPEKRAVIYADFVNQTRLQEEMAVAE